MHGGVRRYRDAIVFKDATIHRTEDAKRAGDIVIDRGHRGRTVHFDSNRLRPGYLTPNQGNIARAIDLNACHASSQIILPPEGDIPNYDVTVLTDNQTPTADQSSAPVDKNVGNSIGYGNCATYGDYVSAGGIQMDPVGAYRNRRTGGAAAIQQPATEYVFPARNIQHFATLSDADRLGSFSGEN